MVVICRAGEPRQDLNPFYFSLLGSICAAASARGYETLVSFQDGAGGFNGRDQEQRKADGLIVIGTTENRAGWDHFRDAGTAGLHWALLGLAVRTAPADSAATTTPGRGSPLAT